VKEGAITVMGEVGVDISGYTSDAMADFDHERFDAVISCCGCGDKLNDEKAVWKARALFEDWNLDGKHHFVPLCTEYQRRAIGWY